MENHSGLSSELGQDRGWERRGPVCLPDAVTPPLATLAGSAQPAAGSSQGLRGAKLEVPPSRGAHLFLSPVSRPGCGSRLPGQGLVMKHFPPDRLFPQRSCPPNRGCSSSSRDKRAPRQQRCGPASPRGWPRICARSTVMAHPLCLTPQAAVAGRAPSPSPRSPPSPAPCPSGR